MPWTKQLNLTADYKPFWAAHKLDFNVALFNVFNSQAPVFINDFFGTTQNSNVDYGRLLNTQPPCMICFSFAYDF